MQYLTIFVQETGLKLNLVNFESNFYVSTSLVKHIFTLKCLTRWNGHCLEKTYKLDFEKIAFKYSNYIQYSNWVLVNRLEDWINNNFISSRSEYNLLYCLHELICMLLCVVIDTILFDSNYTIVLNKYM